ncbi:unnamed protein product [Heterosigma akashiwo]
MSPHETLFLESTSDLDIKLVANNPFVQFQIWDFPGDYDFRGDLVYGGQLIDEAAGSPVRPLILVIDAQLYPIVHAAGGGGGQDRHNPRIAFRGAGAQGGRGPLPLRRAQDRLPKRHTAVHD